MNLFEQEWFLTILGAIASGLSLLIGWVFVSFRAWIDTKNKNEKFNIVISATIDVIESTVLDLKHSVVNDLKKDGKFDKENQKLILETAKARVLSTMANASIIILKEYIGNPELWITEQIEKAVINYKKWEY